MWGDLILLFCALAAISDVRRRRIPRGLCLLGLGAGLLFHFLEGGWRGALGAASLGLALGVLLFQLGALGGGDGKMLAALGALLGWRLWLAMLGWALILAGVLAVLQLARRGALRQGLKNILELLQGWFSGQRQPKPELHVGNSGAVRAPFAVPLALATLLVMVWS